jgi:hypothetical protein
VDRAVRCYRYARVVAWTDTSSPRFTPRGSSPKHRRGVGEERTVAGLQGTPAAARVTIPLPRCTQAEVNCKCVTWRCPMTSPMSGFWPLDAPGLPFIEGPIIRRYLLSII